MTAPKKHECTWPNWCAWCRLQASREWQTIVWNQTQNPYSVRPAPPKPLSFEAWNERETLRRQDEQDREESRRYDERRGTYYRRGPFD